MSNRNIIIQVFFLLVLFCGIVRGQDWKNQIIFPDDSFAAQPTVAAESAWVKFTIKLNTPNTVYFQDSQLYLLHHEFASSVLDPYIGISSDDYYQVALYETGQEVALGTVLMPPVKADGSPEFLEYGIQFVRQDPYTKEQIAAMFDVVKSNVIADPNTQAFYFPTFEQSQVAEDNLQWFIENDIPVSSSARWAQGNAGYSEGWALGKLKFFSAGDIDNAYQQGLLEPDDILITDGVPAEIPYVAGVISLAPSTPSSHVAILSKTYVIPFVYLAVETDADYARQLIGNNIALTAYSDKLEGYTVKLLDVEGTLTQSQIDEILQLKKPPVLDISPMVDCGSYGGDTTDLYPSDVNCFGGKASNFGILRRSIPDNSPVAAALSFDVWNEFMDQPISPVESITIDPGGYAIFWADGQPQQGANHLNFALKKSGEDIALFSFDGNTMVDGLSYASQSSDKSYGRQSDGSDIWNTFSENNITFNASNPGTGTSPLSGLFINEFMADNDSIVTDEYGEYDDWLEIYNAGSTVVNLSGMYLTDDLTDPTKHLISVGITGSTLRQEISNRLSSYTYPVSDLAALSADLAAIRNIIKDPQITTFSPTLENAILQVLQDPAYDFEPFSMIRFRSSTNVEDTEQFTGAGLYDSYSGCLADDLDSETTGPCNCDPNEPNEKSIFRAIRKVFASFYNNNAFLERLRHNINEADVGMAIMAHHSFPDEIEMANGVATIEKTGSGSNMYISLVTQAGANSVTNPDITSIPEEVSGRVFSSGYTIPPKLLRSSNLVPLGTTVMQWDQDYRNIIDLFKLICAEFTRVTGKTEYMLDIEYKKLAPGGVVAPAGGLIIKQVRQIPAPESEKNITPYLINQPTEYRLYSGEYKFRANTDIFADHRLKTRLTLQTRNTWLDDPNKMVSIYGEADFEYVNEDGEIVTLTEKLPLFPSPSHDFAGNTSLDNWVISGQNSRRYSLKTENLPTFVSAAENPLFVVHDFGTQPFNIFDEEFRVLTLSVDYDKPVRSWVGAGCSPLGDRATLSSELHLWQVPPESPDDILEEYNFTDNGITINTSFYRPPAPQSVGVWEMTTAPMSRWVQTTITGYTTQPVVLQGYYSQTYHAGHHNIIENFLFEPALEPSIELGILDELASQDIRYIRMTVDHSTVNADIATYGFNYLPGDFNSDGLANMGDFNILANVWNKVGCCACNGADLTGDGDAGLDDLLILASNWLVETGQ